MIGKEHLFLALSSICLVALLCHGAKGQRSAFNIEGSVCDQDGGAIVGAKVELFLADILVDTISTDQAGDFLFSSRPGEYLIRISANGFTILERSVVLSKANEILALTLQVESTQSVVDVKNGNGYKIDTISSATKTFTSLRDVPQAISITTREQISDQNLSSIGEVVRYQPGITAHQGENNRDQIIIRGQSSSADFFINGIRDDVQYFRDLYNLERVEMLGGPNALVFGRGGGGGVINRVTKEADFTSGSSILLQGGTYGNLRATFDLNKPINKKFSLRLNGVSEYSNSFRKDVSLRRFGFSPTVTFSPDARTHITASAEMFLDHRIADRGITSFQGRPADVPISTYYGNAEDSRVTAKGNLFSTSIDREFGKLLIRNRTMFGDFDRFYQNYVPGTANTDGTLVTLAAYNNATRRENFFNQTDLVYYTNIFGLKHAILGGIEIGHQKTRNFRQTGFFNNTVTTIQVAFSDPVTTVPVSFRQSATDADNRVNVNLAAVYTQDQIEVNKYLQFIAGVRFDYFDLEFYNNRNKADFRRIDRLVSPRLGVILKPFSQVSLYGSYSVSHLPSSGDQFSSLTNITAQVKPEMFTNYEIGAKWDIRSNLQLTSAVYRLDRTNTRSIDPNDPTLIIQTGAQRTNGFELGFNGSVTRKWSMTGGYAYQDAFIAYTTVSATAGNKVAQVPHHNFSVWNKYRLSHEFSAGLGLIHRTDMFAGVDNTVVLPGYTRADAAIYYSFNEHWLVQANIENVLNTSYFLNADSNTNISPGPPRSVKISLNTRF